MTGDVEFLRECIQGVYEADERLWQHDYLKRNWLASFAAHAVALADFVAELLDSRSYAMPMPTTTGSSRQSTEVQTGGSQTTEKTINAKDLAVQLDNSQSSVIYVDLPGCDDEQAAAMLSGDPPLHVEHDAVRDKWAVRKATNQEVSEAQAAAESAKSTSSSSSSSTSTQ